MKWSLLILLPLVFLFGCSSIELESLGATDRVVTGTVNFSLGERLPADAVLTIRVIDTSDPKLGPKLLGELEVTDPGMSPVAFKVEFRAEDALLRRGVKIEARIAVGGRLRYSNATNYAVTASNVSQPRELWLAATGG